MTNEPITAIQFAYEVHASQRRKYTNEPYVSHLAEVAGIAMMVGANHPSVYTTGAVAWLHDSVEDQDVPFEVITDRFGSQVAIGVSFLSDIEVGNRAQRKAASRERLSKAPGWVQDIKVADLISNTKSIVQHDPKFALVYLEEKRLLLDVLTKANPTLLAMAHDLSVSGLEQAKLAVQIPRSMR